MRKMVRLLIIDDSARYSDLVRGCADMWNEGYVVECEHAGTAEVAFELMRCWRPSVVLLDAFLPDMVYTDFLERCRTVEAPFVVMSDHPVDGIAESVLEKGAFGYVPKSEDPEDIEFILDKIAEISEDFWAEH